MTFSIKRINDVDVYIATERGKLVFMFYDKEVDDLVIKSVSLNLREITHAEMSTRSSKKYNISEVFFFPKRKIMYSRDCVEELDRIMNEETFQQWRSYRIKDLCEEESLIETILHYQEQIADFKNEEFGYEVEEAEEVIRLIKELHDSPKIAEISSEKIEKELPTAIKDMLYVYNIA